MRVLIRSDASPTIGSGHIARLLPLARILRKQGSHVAFGCRLLPGHRLDSLANEGFETFALPARYPDEDPQQAIESMLPWQADIDALAQALENHPPFDWIIVDHYGLDHHWQTAARRWAPRIAAVDDLATRPYASTCCSIRTCRVHLRLTTHCSRRLPYVVRPTFCDVAR